MSVKCPPLGRRKVAAVWTWKGGLCQVQIGRAERAPCRCLSRRENKTRHFPACFAAFLDQWFSWLPEPVQPVKGGPVQNVSRCRSNVRNSRGKDLKKPKMTEFRIAVERSTPQLPAAAANCTDPDTMDIMSYESLTPSPTCTGARPSCRTSQ